MRLLYKFFCEFSLVCILVVLLSISAFASGVYNDSDFVPVDSPSYSGAESDGVVYFNVAIPSRSFGYVAKWYSPLSDDYFYTLTYIDLNISSPSITSFDWKAYAYVNGSNVYSLITLTPNTSLATSFTRLYSQGSQYNSNVFLQSGSDSIRAWSNTTVYYRNNYTNAASPGIKIDNTGVDNDELILCGYSPLKSITADVSVTNHFSDVASNIISLSNTSVKYSTYQVQSLDNLEEIYYCVRCSDVVNGYLTYTSDSPISTDIIINGILSGTVEPIFDNNGNIVSYSINNEINVDFTDYYNAIREMQAEGLEIPDYAILNPDDYQFPSVEIDSGDLSDLEIMSGGSALTWFYARFNDLTTGNIKILSLITSCLSLGFIMLILNKRS